MINGHLSGNLLLKVVLRESGLDAKYTTTHVRSSLASLDAHMKSINDEISKFNACVQDLLRYLSERGETTHDLLINLAKGY